MDIIFYALLVWFICGIFRTLNVYSKILDSEKRYIDNQLFLFCNVAVRIVWILWIWYWIIMIA